MPSETRLSLRARCPNQACRQWAAIDAKHTTCSRCQSPLPRLTGALPRADETLAGCPLCGGAEFFIRKDFPQKLGMAMVVLFGAVASVFYYYEKVPATFGTLAALVAIDAVIYLFVGKVTVCYRCRAEFRGLLYNEAHQGFDLATAEKYRS